MKHLITATIVLLAALSAQADVTLNGLFTDHMVLQREMPVSVYGQADPGEKVTVTFAGQEKATVAGKEGQWAVKLDSMKAATKGSALTVAGKSTLALKDILVGDIWVCSGQSNMEMSLGGCRRPEDVKNANYPLLRQFNVTRTPSPAPLTDTKGQWQVCTPKTAGRFTAVGFYFGRSLVQETGVPIGLIQSAWGGTRIEPWVCPEGMAGVASLAGARKQLDAKIQTYIAQLTKAKPKLDAYLVAAQKAIEEGTTLPAPVALPKYPISGTRDWQGLYNGMIHPLTRFAIKGAIWYQGESNGGEGESYFQKKRALIEGWRKVWGQGDFPFYFVQLANFRNPSDNPAGGDGWAKLRMAQSKSLTIPNTGMAVAIELADVDNPRDIHPKNKRDVGDRLALWALAKDYGQKDLVYSGPLYKSMTVEGKAIRIAFDSVGTGLLVATKKGFAPVVADPAGKLKRFAIAGADKKWVWADAVIDGNTVVVSSPKVANPVAVRYAYTMNPAGCNLYNKEGLPASPFRTDGW